MMRRKIFKKYLIIFIILFTLLNGLLYWVEYRRYVISAPAELKEARKEFTKAMIPHIYYTFLVKTVRIDFQNPILFPLKDVRDYYYHKGLKKLPPDEAEGALWFNLFEARLYNYSVKARYGSIVKHYGYTFSKHFIDKVYDSIKILSNKHLRDYGTSELGGSVAEAYLDLINIYVADFHLNPNGYLFNTLNMNRVSTDIKLYHRFVNIYMWERDFLAYHKEHHPFQYAGVMNSHKGWYSSYINYYDNLLDLSSFILFYKIHNNFFFCESDKMFLDSIKEAKNKLINFSQHNVVPNNQKETLHRQISYLEIDNVLDGLKSSSTNPLKSKIYCKYKTNKE